MRLLAATKTDSWKKAFDQPAKLAETVRAPGDGAAEPGDRKQNAPEPTKWAIEGTSKEVGLE